jgi:hypothetical protein
MAPQLARKVVQFTSVALLMLSGCASQPPYAGDFPASTQLAISPDGKRLFAFWNDHQGAPHGRLLELDGAVVTSRRELLVPSNLRSIEFTEDNQHLLVTTHEQGRGELLKVHLTSGHRTSLYKNQFGLAFAKETRQGDHVFLESDGKASTWKRLRHGQVRQLSLQPFLRRGAPISAVGGNLFQTVPTSPTSFLTVHGNVPSGINQLLTPSTFVMRCADGDPWVCVRTELFTVNDRNSYYAAGLSLFNRPRKRCDVAGRWVDLVNLSVSSDGSTVAFHAAIEKLGGERAIYVIKNDAKCRAQQISLQ